MINVQVFMPLDRFACAHSARKTSTANFRTMTYRLENRGGRFSWKARGSSLMSSLQNRRARRERVSIESLSIRSKTPDSATPSKGSIR